jgi:hypothetical protein
MGNYRTTYIELDDFRVSCIQGYPYEGFVIGCGYAYVENMPSEMAILENSSYIYNPIKVQQIDTSLLAIIKSLHLTHNDICNKLVSEKGDMYILNIPEGPLTIPKKDSEIIISTDESDTYFNIKIEVKSKDINETYNYEYNNYHIDRSSIELLKLLGTKDTSKVLDYINKLNEKYHINDINDINDVLSGFADGLENTGKTRISNKFKLYFEKNNGYVFYGNQYVKTYSLKKIGERLGGTLKWVGAGFDVIEIYGAYEEEGGVGEKTKKTIVKIGGSYLGSSVGILIGTTVLGVLTGGIGIPAVAAIAGFLGAVVGGYVGGEIGEDISVELYEEVAK